MRYPDVIAGAIASSSTSLGAPGLGLVTALFLHCLQRHDHHAYTAARYSTFLQLDAGLAFPCQFMHICSVSWSMYVTILQKVSSLTPRLQTAHNSGNRVRSSMLACAVMEVYRQGAQPVDSTKSRAAAGSQLRPIWFCQSSYPDSFQPSRSCTSLLTKCSEVLPDNLPTW